ncbi:hypothetical protein FRC15_001565 [Serendipita sp. 397]|nr:hypothetical protein FRC15_001565 [Serendipita sp. 397]
MSDPSAVPSQTPSADITNSRTPKSISDKAQRISSSSSRPESPSGAQEVSYFSTKPLDSSITALSEYSCIQNKPANTPGGPCYTRDELFHLRKSPLVAPPANMPARKDWFGEANEQLSKPKDHDSLAATRMRHRRDHDAEDPSRPSESSRSLFTSGPAQPSQMGSFRHQSFRDRGSDIDKDTASLKSMAERYDRGDRLGPQSPGIAGFTNRVKDRDTAPHFPGSATRIGQVPRRTETREPRQRKPGDVATDWRKNADPGRERSEARNETTRGGREPSRTRPGDDNNGDRKKRDRSRGLEEDSRKWRDDSSVPRSERKARDASTTREDKDMNGNARNGRRRGDDEERAEANRKRKEERDKETPAWFDDDVPLSGASKGIVGAKMGDELDELQKWKLEKKAREEQKERDSNPLSATDDTDEYELQSPAIPDEHKTPKPSNTHPDLPSSVPPLPHNPVDASRPNGNALDHLKALMGIPNGEAKESVDHEALEPNSEVSNNEPSLSLPAFFATSSMGSRPVQNSSTIGYEALEKASADESRRNIPDYDAPIVSRHAFAQPRANASPTAPNGTGFGVPIKATDGTSPITSSNLSAPPGLRPLQSAEPSHRTRNAGEMPGSGVVSRAVQNASPAGSLSGGNNPTPAYAHRPPPPHMNVNDHAPLLHLPASAGAGAVPKDGNLNVLSVLAPQPHATSVNSGPMGAVGLTSRVQNASPQQNLLSRLGILNPQERKGSPKTVEGGYDRGSNTDLRMPLPQQYAGSGPPSAISRDSYASPANERFETHSAAGDVRFGMGHASNSSTSSFGPSPVGGSNPTSNLAAKGSRLAKFFDNTRGEEMTSPGAMHGSVMGGVGPNGLQDRSGLVTPPQFDHKGQGAPDLLALLQGASLHGPHQVNRVSNGPEQANYRDELSLHRQRELALQQQQQQIREREARQLEQQLYALNHDIYDSRGSFVSNDLVPGLRPPIQRQERDPYISERLDERLNYAAHGRIPGVPGGYDQMMRAMSGAPTRGNAMMYSGAVPGQGGIANQFANELLQQQQLQQRERQRQAQQQRQELERAQLLAMQANGLGPRSQGANILPQIAARQNSVDPYSRGGRLSGNELQSASLGAYPGFGGNGINPNGSSLGGLNVNGGFGGLNAGNHQLRGYDNSLRQQQAALQQQRQGNLGMGFSGIGGIDGRYGQQPPMHGGQIQNQGNAQANDLMALLLSGNIGNHQN